MTIKITLETPNTFITTVGQPPPTVIKYEIPDHYKGLLEGLMSYIEEFRVQ